MAGDGRLLLIVDDDEDLQQLLKASLVKEGYGVQTFSDTMIASQWLQLNKPALILLDIMMARGSGLDFCRWLRGEPELGRIPIVVMSGMRSPNTAKLAQEMGASEFLKKPFDIQALKGALERLAGGGRS